MDASFACGRPITAESMQAFITGLDRPAEERARLLALTPATCAGRAVQHPGSAQAGPCATNAYATECPKRAFETWPVEPLQAGESSKSVLAQRTSRLERFCRAGS